MLMDEEKDAEHQCGRWISDCVRWCKALGLQRSYQFRPSQASAPDSPASVVITATVNADGSGKGGNGGRGGQTKQRVVSVAAFRDEHARLRLRWEREQRR